MKLLILNDEDPWMMRKQDVRAWSFHGLWFAEPGDFVVALDEIPPEFLNHVAAMKGFDPESLKLFVMPEGSFARAEFDGIALLDPVLLRAIQDADGFDRISSIEALWQTPAVARFATALGIPSLLEGHGFIAACGYEVANSKAGFKAIAAGVSVPVPAGFVARSKLEAVEYTIELMRGSSAVVAKRDHGGAGGGNHLLHTADWAGSPDTAGAARYTKLSDSSPECIEAFWEDHWTWMSNSLTAPVVIEVHMTGRRSFYAEFLLKDDSISGPYVGEMVFRQHGLDLEVYPGQLDESVAGELQAHGVRLARIYRELGYRGRFSADAIIADSGDIVFTEVNARYTGSSHMYGVMPFLPGTQGGDASRTVLQGLVAGGSLSVVLERWKQLDVDYSPSRGTGVVALTPEIGANGPLLFDVIARSKEEADRLLALASLVAV